MVLVFFFFLVFLLKKKGTCKRGPQGLRGTPGEFANIHRGLGQTKLGTEKEGIVKPVVEGKSSRKAGGDGGEVAQKDLLHRAA